MLWVWLLLVVLLSMSEPEPQNLGIETTPILPPLPFTYERTYERDKAEIDIYRANPWKFSGLSGVRTDAEAVYLVDKDKRNREWFTTDEWRKKGKPHEQFEFTFGNGKQITLYNFNKELSFTPEHERQATAVLGLLASRFPKALEKIRWILIDDHQGPSGLGDNELYPTNGSGMPQWHAFLFRPRGLELIRHRVSAATNFEGTLAHELTHLFEDDFRREWQEHFRWALCDNNHEDWESRTPPTGAGKRWFNKHTGEMAPQGQFPLQPEKCINYYAKINVAEDICESMVAYLYDPESLKKISPEKYEILARHDAHGPKVEVSIRKVPKDQIELPEVKPQTVYYYVKENQEEAKNPDLLVLTPEEVKV